MFGGAQKFQSDPYWRDHLLFYEYFHGDNGASHQTGWTGLVMIPAQEQAIRLSPRDPFNGGRYAMIGVAHLLQSRTDEAIVWLEKGRNLSPRLALPHAYLASAYALKGDLGRASAELAEARRLGRDGRFSSIARLKAAGTFGVSKIRPLYETTYSAGLRKAGMPEE